MANDRPVPQSGKPPYPFRTGWAIFLLAGNLLIAAMYFHIINL
ncbi:photosystem I protein PsaX [Oscillatoria salina]|nr:photosystem I protein PsaX [Oscillatoria salina]MBZ8182584.1 photosystem one PsaX [Oscillatoria salina IIICB1]NET90031.1 photosystem one PsaX [Kamptonema sp. SIO1D9]